MTFGKKLVTYTENIEYVRYSSMSIGPQIQILFVH